MKIDVCFTPQDYGHYAGQGDHAVAVLDVLRATTSMVAAFAGGCRRIIPVGTVEEAQAGRLANSGAILAGERHALPIPGFNLGNSPLEFAGPAVRDRTVIMTTTNGTLAFRAAKGATLVYAGAFVNAAAAARALAASGLDAVILCAGTQGRFSLEDALCAGLLAGRLAGIGELSDAAVAAAALYERCRSDIAGYVGRCAHARYLASIGFAADIEFSLREDVYDLAPRYMSGEIVAEY